VIGALALVGAIVLAAGSVAPGVRVPVVGALWCQGIGLALIGAAGAVVVGGHEAVGSAFRSGIHPGVGIDALTGFFLVVIAVTALPVLLYAAGYLPGTPRSGAVAGLTGGFLLALVGVVVARDAVGFLCCWELMTILPAMAALIARPDADVRRAIFEYLAITHVAGVGVWITVLVMAEQGVLGGASLTAHGTLVVTGVGIAALIGFGAKSGLVPLHVWLPRTHPVAPSHLSALMSGVMVKVALYGLMRVCFWWMTPAPVWMGIALVVVGAVSALAGISGALVQRELKRLLAYSSVENVGVIAAGLGASIVLARAGNPTWASIAFAAALLHTLNHAVMKAGLFLSAGSIERATGEHRLDNLGGLLRRMPWTGAGCGVIVLAMAGVPPLNGFVSEWLILESLLHAGLSGGTGSVVSALGLAALAAAVGLALVCFVKLGGLALLGEPRSDGARAAQEVGRPMRAGVVALAGMCLVLGVVPGIVLQPLLRILPGGDEGAPHTLGIWLPGTGGLPVVGLIVVLVAGTALLVRARGPRTAPAPVWNCGQIDEPALAWTGAGFTSGLRLSFRGIVRTERTLERDHDAGIVQEVRYAQAVPNLFDTGVYHPAQRVALTLAGLARRLQSGRLATYVAYLVGLLIALLVIARLVGG
jgi:hydrogenase-4 component B